MLVEDSRANKRLKAVREAQRLKAKRKKAMDAKVWRELSSEEKMALKESEHGFFWHLNERESFIIWMPTYRQHKNDAGNRDKLQKAYKKSVDDGRWELLAMEALKEKNKPVMPFGMPEIHDTDELKRLDKLLGDAGIKLYFRPHPAQDLYYVSQVELENVRIANDDFLRRCEVSLYDLLESSEALITDYSSVFFEYLLLDKPILFYAPDLEKYTDKRGFYINYNKLPGRIVRDKKNLKYNIKEALYNDDMSEQREDFRTRFMNGCDGKATKRIMDYIEGHI